MLSVKIPFVGGSYVYPNNSFDAQLAINCFPTISESGDSRSDSMMRPTQGKKLFSTLDWQPIRASISIITNYYVLAYDKFIEVFQDGTFNIIGTITTSSSGSASMAYNGLQVIIVDGTPTGGWIYTLSDNSFDQISDMNFQGGITVQFITDYFMINRPNSGVYQISALADGSSWPNGQFANAESEPDNLLAIEVLNQQAYLLGQNTIQVAYNSGGDLTDPTIFTFSTLPGVFLQYGVAASFGNTQVNNTILFIGLDAAGDSIVWMIQNYLPVRISTQAIENYLSQYDLTNVTTLSYEFDGHYFIQWNIPGAPYSIVFDMLTQQWHYRSRWNPATGKWERDRADTHVFIWDKHLVTDYENGNIYEMSAKYRKDDTFLPRRIKRFPYFIDTLEYMFISFMQLDCQVGVGTLTGNPEDINPLVSVRWSDDQGNTWSNSLQRSLGTVGNYNHRVFWNRGGKTRARIFELDFSTDVEVNLMSFFIKFIKGRG